MKLTIHPAVFMFGSLLLCVAWLALRPAPQPMPFAIASRSSAPETPRIAHAAIRLEAATLLRYRGEYRLPAGVSVFISVDGDRLFALAPDTPQLELVAYSETEFFVRELDAEVAFDVDSDGLASRFTARFPTGSMTAKRVGR